MSESTVVSTLPWTLVETTATLVPYSHVIKGASTPGGIGVSTIPDAFYLRLIPMMDDKVPAMRVHVPSEDLVKAIVNDFIGANVGISYEVTADGSVSIPGIFSIPGIVNEQVILTKHKDQVTQAVKNTTLWFTNLVRKADDEWERTHQYRAIDDVQRRGAKFLGLDKEWCKDVVFMSQVNCWACKTKVHGEAIICSGCGAVLNMDAYTKNKDKFVTK